MPYFAFAVLPWSPLHYLPILILVFICNFHVNFSLQPVRDTREKQVKLWKELILDYCRTQKIFMIDIEENFPLFSNPAIESKSRTAATLGSDWIVSDMLLISDN